MNPFQTAFALPFDQRLAHAVDLIVFNPPYVPTIAEEADVAQKEMGIQGAWAGGDDGMDVTNQFLDMVPVSSACTSSLIADFYHIPEPAIPQRHILSCCAQIK